MSNNDVHSPPPEDCSQSNPAQRFIFQFFNPPDIPTSSLHASHNKDARLPINIEELLPPIIVDMFYGCIAILKWKKVQDVSDIIPSRSMYYDGIDSSGSSPGRNEEKNGNSGYSKGKKQQAKARRDRHYSKASPLDAAMDFVGHLWSLHAPDYQERPPSALEQDRSRDKVGNWLQTQ